MTARKQSFRFHALLVSSGNRASCWAGWSSFARSKDFKMLLMNERRQEARSRLHSRQQTARLAAVWAVHFQAGWLQTNPKIR